MFGFLKDKLKSAISIFSKKVDEEAKDVEVFEEDKKEKLKEEVSEKPKKEVKKLKKEEKKPEKKSEKKPEKKEEKQKSKNKVEKKPEKKEEKPKKVEKKEESKPVEIKEETFVEEKISEVEKDVVLEKGFFARWKEKIVGPAEEVVVQEEKKEVVVEEPKKEIVEEKPVEVVVEEKKGFFASLKEKVTTKRISSEQFDELFWELELALLENNVAVEVIEKIKLDLKTSLVDRPLPRSKIQDEIVSVLKNSVSSLFDFPSFDLILKSKEHRPFVVCLVGVNGSGKTTSIAKLAHYLEKKHVSCVIAAADTFRAAAIDQLQLHADKLGIKLIKQDYGSDAAAVAFDAIKHAEAKKKDVVLIDTAGRLHSNVNLMDEMKKIVRVAKPHLKIFIGESITGNDCVEQARLFDEAIGIDGIILSKADIDEKGGAALSVSYVTKKPILYLGTGQEYDDLELFDKDKMMKRLGL